MRTEFDTSIKTNYFIISKLPENNFPPKTYLLPKQNYARSPLRSEIEIKFPKKPDPFEIFMAELRTREKAREAAWQAFLARLSKPEPWIKTLLPPNKDLLPLIPIEKIEPRKTETKLDPFALTLAKQKYRP